MGYVSAPELLLLYLILFNLFNYLFLILGIIPTCPHWYQVLPSAAVRSKEWVTCINQLAEAISPPQKYQLMKAYSYHVIKK